MIGYGIFNQLLPLIKSRKLHRNLFIVIDKNVDKHFGGYIRNYFNNYEGKIFYYSLNAVEKSKSIGELKKIYESLLDQKFGRDTLLISIGGGVTGDLAGFAAATFMRGIQIIHIPTTLTACVDSAIGGKTGINFNYFKNIIGSFYQPQFVLCDTKFLEKLPEIEVISGLGEIIKYAFTTNLDFFTFVEENIDLILAHDKKALESIITESVNYKTSVVSLDEKEQGLRKVLNFGHTFAHAFERDLKNKVKHGEAVSAGIVCALYLSYKKNLLSKIKLEHYKKLPLSLKVSKSLKSVDAERIYENMFADKKNRSSKINFVLIRDIGEMVLDVNASKQDIIYAINNSIDNLD